MKNFNKYGARKTTIDGITFDSKKEAERWCELKLLERVGQIEGLKRQVKFVLIPTQKIDGKVAERECAYKADFCYYKNGELVVEDTKGLRTDAYIIKRKLMLDIYGIRIREV